MSFTYFVLFEALFGALAALFVAIQSRARRPDIEKDEGLT